MDDVLISERTQEEHDARLHAALQKIQSTGGTLNKEKCEFNEDCIDFLGHIIDKCGISPAPQKTSAILEMEKPQTPTELCRFMGTVNQLSKFTPNIAGLSKPLCELLSSMKAWVWGPSQDEAFEKVKMETDKASSPSTVQPRCPNKDQCRCLSIWPGSSSSATGVNHTMETSCLRLPSNE